MMLKMCDVYTFVVNVVGSGAAEGIQYVRVRDESVFSDFFLNNN